MAGVAGRSGRRPDPDAARRLRAGDPSSTVKWVNLPPEGNLADPPEMPPPPAFVTEDGEWTIRAIDLWNRLWKSPQSTKWQTELHPTLDRYMFITERMWLSGVYSSAELTALQKIEESLGLTPQGMRHMYWRIHAEESTGAPELASVTAVNAGLKKDNRRNIEY
jgi:hypothetical protein